LKPGASGGTLKGEHGDKLSRANLVERLAAVTHRNSIRQKGAAEAVRRKSSASA